METDITKNIEDNVEELPQEVSDFIFGDAMEKVIAEIAPLLGDNIEQKNHIQNDLTFFLCGNLAFEDVEKYIDSITTVVETRTKIKAIIQEKIFDELELLMEVNQELENAPGSSNILSRLNQSFTAPATLAPIKRDVSTPSSGTESSPLPASSEKRIDPYREIPEV